MIRRLTALLVFLGFANADPQHDHDREAQEEAKKALTRLEKDYILLKNKQVEIEYTFSFTYYSANQIYLESFAILDPVFLTLGRFGIERARRHIFVNSIAFRLGIMDNLQFDVNVPYVYRYDRISRGQQGNEETLERGDLGDISVNLSIQPIRETKSRPAIVLNFGYKFKTGKSPYRIDPNKDVPTGTGYRSAKFSVSWVKSVDPVVVFGSLGYTYNFPESVNQSVDTGNGVDVLEKVYPGDNVNLALGFAYALAYNFSMNVQYINTYVFSSYIKKQGSQKLRVPNSTFNLAMLKLGTGWALTPKVPLSFSLYLGLTQDSPDYTVELRLPFKF